MARHTGFNETPILGSVMITPEARLLAGIIDSVDPINYTCSIHFSDSEGVRPDVPLPIYYNSVAGWSRLIPEEGISVLVAFRPGFKAEILRYYPASVSKTAVQNYAQGLNLFRDLVPGEQDTMSSGKAGWWETSEGRYLGTGGVASLELSKEDLEATLEAGTIILTTPQVNDWCKAHLGTVKREVEGYKKIITKDAIPFSQGGVELKEFSVSIGWNPSSVETLETGPKLAQFSLGSVVDEGGNPEKWATSDLPLRARLRAFNAKNSFTTDITIDEQGNLGILTPLTATNGVFLQVQGGFLEAEVAEGINFHSKGIQLRSDTVASLSSLTSTTIGSDGSVLIVGKGGIQILSPTIDFGGATLSMGAATDLSLSAAKTGSLSGDAQATLVSKIQVLLDAPEISLGSNAVLHLILETFLELYNSHTHPGVKAGNDESLPPSIPADTTYLTSVTIAE